MHLVVDHPRQQQATGGVDHEVVALRPDLGGDAGDAAVLDAQVTFGDAAFIDQTGVDDDGGGHQGFLEGQEGEGCAWPQGGTGSYPPGCRGWQRPIRRSASQPPLTGPKRAIASMAYSEHDGTKRQRGPSIGLMKRL